MKGWFQFVQMAQTTTLKVLKISVMISRTILILKKDQSAGKFTWSPVHQVR